MKKIFFSFLLIVAIFGPAIPRASLAMVAGTSQNRQLAVAVKKPAIKTVKKTAVKVAVKKKAVVPELTAKDLLGRMVLELQSENKLWYVDPISQQRYYLKNDDDLQALITSSGRKPTAKEFAGLAQNIRSKTSAVLIAKYRGSIIISPSDGQSAYYFNPADNIIYQIKSFSEFYNEIAKVVALGASDALLRQIPMNTAQVTYDPAFNGIAYVKYDGVSYSGGLESDRILPLASLSKVMTALVFIGTNPDWNKIIEITPEEIRYPCTLQACGSTSEINLKAGDKLRVIDLWVAMLSASSNQSAVILADNSGLSRSDFIKQMNQQAKDMGLLKTYFTEMSGLSANNVSTAKEYAKVAKTAFDNSWIAEATRNTDYSFTVEQADGTPRPVRVLNRNTSLLAMGPDASKTGFLTEAQRNAVIAKNGTVIIALHCYSLGQRNSIVKNLLGENQLAQAQ